MKSNLKKITTGNLVNEIINVAGVSKGNAVSIMNLMTNTWNVDRVGFLKGVDTGIALRKTTAKKATNKKSVAKKKTAKKSTAKKNKKAVAPDEKKAIKKKSKKKLKNSNVVERTPTIVA